MAVDGVSTPWRAKAKSRRTLLERRIGSQIA
jgi:hypothetical protein